MLSTEKGGSMNSESAVKPEVEATEKTEETEHALGRMVVKARRVADVLKGFMGTVRVISHHDADGICSAAIIVRALAREGKPFHLSFIKQLYEEDTIELGGEGNRLTMFLDMGSGQLGTIQKHLINDSQRVIISDHHQIQGEIVSDNVMHINPNEFGIDNNISGSGMAYLIARAMNPENKDLSDLAVVGAIGDSQIGAIGPDWGLMGLNKEILKDAQNTSKIRVTRGLRIWGRTTRPIHKALEYSVDPFIPGVSGSESGAVHFLQELGINMKDENNEWRTLSSLTKKEMKTLTTGIIKERIGDNRENPDWILGEVYDLIDKDGLKDANEFATILNSAGKQGMGYVGVALCLNNKEYFPMVGDMLKKYRREIGKSLRWVENNMEYRGILRRTENANYIRAGGKISETVISNVVSILNRSDFLPATEKDKPIFAFVDTERGDVKVSARASDVAVDAGLSLKEVVAEAVKGLGGEGGGHAGAAGASLPKGSEEMFINRLEEILKKLKETISKAAKEAEDGTTESTGGKDGVRDTVKPEERAERKGSEREEGEGGSKGREGKAEREAEEGVKKAEGKGLVRYLGS